MTFSLLISPEAAIGTKNSSSVFNTLQNHLVNDIIDATNGGNYTLGGNLVWSGTSSFSLEMPLYFINNTLNLQGTSCKLHLVDNITWDGTGEALSLEMDVLAISATTTTNDITVNSGYSLTINGTTVLSNDTRYTSYIGSVNADDTFDIIYGEYLVLNCTGAHTVTLGTTGVQVGNKITLVNTNTTNIMTIATTNTTLASSLQLKLGGTIGGTTISSATFVWISTGIWALVDTGY